MGISDSRLEERITPKFVRKMQHHGGVCAAAMAGLCAAAARMTSLSSLLITNLAFGISFADVRKIDIPLVFIVFPAQRPLFRQLLNFSKT